MLGQLAHGLHPVILGRRAKQIEQGRWFGPGDDFAFKQRTPLRHETPNATMCLVARGMVEINLPMVDNWVIPVHHVDGPVGTHLDVHWPKRKVTGAEDGLDLLCGIAAALFLQLVADRSVGSKVIG